MPTVGTGVCSIVKVGRGREDRREKSGERRQGPRRNCQRASGRTFHRGRAKGPRNQTTCLDRYRPPTVQLGLPGLPMNKSVASAPIRQAISLVCFPHRETAPYETIPSRALRYFRGPRVDRDLLIRSALSILPTIVHSTGSSAPRFVLGDPRRRYRPTEPFPLGCTAFVKPFPSCQWCNYGAHRARPQSSARE